MDDGRRTTMAKSPVVAALVQRPPRHLVAFGGHLGDDCAALAEMHAVGVLSMGLCRRRAGRRRAGASPSQAFALSLEREYCSV